MLTVICYFISSGFGSYVFRAKSNDDDSKNREVVFCKVNVSTVKQIKINSYSCKKDYNMKGLESQYLIEESYIL